MTELEQAIAKFSGGSVDMPEYSDDDKEEYYVSVGTMRRLVGAARVVADIERLPPSMYIIQQVISDDGKTNWRIQNMQNSDLSAIRETLPLALRAALEKVGG